MFNNIIITNEISLEDEVLYSKLSDEKLVQSIDGMRLTLDSNFCVFFDSGKALKNYKLLLRLDTSTDVDIITCIAHPQTNLNGLKFAKYDIDAISLTVPFLLFNVEIVIHQQQRHEAYFTLLGNLEFFL